jgi:hypothetical protein
MMHIRPNEESLIATLVTSRDEVAKNRRRGTLSQSSMSGVQFKTYMVNKYVDRTGKNVNVTLKIWTSLQNFGYEARPKLMEQW